MKHQIKAMLLEKESFSSNPQNLAVESFVFERKKAKHRSGSLATLIVL